MTGGALGALGVTLYFLSVFSMLNRVSAAIVLWAVLFVSQCYADMPTLSFPLVAGTAVPPYSWIDTNTNQSDGYTRYIINRLAKDLEFKPLFKRYPNTTQSLFETYAEAVSQGEINIFAYTHRELSDASPLHMLKTPHFNINGALFINAAFKKDVTGWKDLKNLKGGFFQLARSSIIAGSVEFSRYARAELNMKGYASNAEVVQAFIRGDIDYMAGVLQPVQVMIRLYSPELEYHVYDELLSSNSIYLYVGKDSALMPQIEKIEYLLRKYKISGFSQQMLKRAMNRFIIYTQSIESKTSLQ